MKHKSLTKLVKVTFLILIVFSGCDYISNKINSEADVVGPITDIHVAFAGGGWRAHTGHSAWTIALLDSGKYQLKDIFKNVKTISSNSGGTWFSTMLMYSDQFVSDIESPYAVENWATSEGWTGKQKSHFKTASDQYTCVDTEATYAPCVADYYVKKKDFTGLLYWKPVVDSLIFRDYSLKNTVLKDDHLPWAKDKSLLIATSFLNNGVVLNKSLKSTKFETFQNYYQACINPAEPFTFRDLPPSCLEGTLKTDVLAATFTSLRKDVHHSKPSFFPILRDAENSDTLNVKYSVNYVIDEPAAYHKKITNSIDYSNLPVMTAAASSSAATGFGASQRVAKTFDIAYELEDDAISFSLKDSTVTYYDTKGKTLEDLAQNKVVKLADGGTVDNSAVAQLVRYIQLNYPDQGEGFNIVAFDNVATKLDTSKGYTGIDISTLFGVKEPFKKKFSYGKFSITLEIATPDFQIFEKNALTTPATFDIPGDDGAHLIYTKYSVTTVDNPALGVTKGTTGTLHAFTCIYPKASVLPKVSAEFDYYENMFEFINQSLAKKSKQGEPYLNYLKEALGLTQVE